MADRLLRAHRTLLLVPVVDVDGVPNLVGGTPDAPVLAPFPTEDDPTVSAAILNTWASIVDNENPESAVGGNPTCAVLDDLELGLDDPETDDELTLCSIGNEQDITFYNVNATVNFLRDDDPNAVNVRNLAYNLMKGPDVRYALVDRAMGEFRYTDPFAAGQIVSIYEATTDALVDVKEDRATIKGTQAFVPTGIVAIEVDVVA